MQSGLQVGDLSHEDGRPSGRFEVGDVLRGHHAALVHQPGKADDMDSLRAFRADPKAAHVFEPVKQFDHVRRRRRLRVVTQPGEAGAMHFRVQGEQGFERDPLGLGQAVGESLEHLLAGTAARGQPDALQHRRGGNEHVGRPQIGQHCPNDRLTAVRGPRRFGAYLQAGTPISQPEAAKAKAPLQFDCVFPAGLIPVRVVGEGGRRCPELASDEGDHRLGQMLAGLQTLAGMSQEAQLNGEPQPVDGAALGPDERQIIGTEHVVPRHFGGIDRDGEQARALVGGQQGTAGHEGLVAKGRSFINQLPFNAILQQGIESQTREELPCPPNPFANDRL